MKKVIVTGGAGFIGSHLVDKLLSTGCYVTVIENFDPYYNRKIKENNLIQHVLNPNLEIIELDITNHAELISKVKKKYDVLIHLAAKAGVRPSINNPLEYQLVNVIGTQNLLELSKQLEIKQFVFASSSSVYGVNPNVPWSEEDHVLQPISPYASSKISAELLGHVYSKLYNIRFIGLRLFTVYGPRQRPDLAIHKFAKKIINNEAIPVYGDGSTQRDYTYVGDIVSGILAATRYNKSSYEIINLGNHRTISLQYMIEVIEHAFNKKAIIDRQPMQPGDVHKTFADISKARHLLAYQPKTDFEAGINAFRDWFMDIQSLVTK